jgi:hypothetical protein
MGSKEEMLFITNYFNLSTVNNEGRVTQSEPVVVVIEDEDESSNPSS